MKKFLMLLSLLSLLMTAGQIHAQVLHGRVVGVSDGDSITVLDAQQRTHKIRLQGIDAPEKAQPYGQKSKQSLSDLVYQQAVQVAWTKQDRYGRTLGQVFRDGTDVNLQQVLRGMAWHYKQYEREQSAQDRVRYAEAQEQARQHRLGLWQDPEPVEPSVFRRQK
jgi:endonuclease YncB( thermonuclease family)